MSRASLELTRATLLSHGVPIFRIDDSAIQLAVRVRSHLMDACVSVHVEPERSVRFTVRAQGSDHPGTGADDMFGKVRAVVADVAQGHGFSELAHECRAIHDPGDDSRTLDLWFELTFEKKALDEPAWLDDVAWALGVAKCISQ